MQFYEKHLVVGPSNHSFTNLYIDVLTHKCGVAGEKLVFVTLDNAPNTWLTDNPDVAIVRLCDCSAAALATARSITLMSFHIDNSGIVKDLYTIDSQLLAKVHIYLTDDEVARWRKNKAQHGRITADNKRIGPTDVEMLPHLKSFITSERAFRGTLENLLGRGDFSIIDVRDPFGTMPAAHKDGWNKLLDLDSVYDRPDNKILLGSKSGRFSVDEVVALLRSFLRGSRLDEYKFILFTDKKKPLKRILIDLYCWYLKVVGRTVVDVSYPTLTNSLTYTSLIMSCSYFVLQDRGGMSSARQYIASGRGIVCVRKGTPNHYELEHGLNLEVIAFTSMADLARQISVAAIDVSENQRKMNAEFHRYYQRLGELYG